LKGGGSSGRSRGPHPLGRRKRGERAVQVNKKKTLVEYRGEEAALVQPKNQRCAEKKKERIAGVEGTGKVLDFPDRRVRGGAPHSASHGKNPSRRKPRNRSGEEDVGKKIIEPRERALQVARERGKHQACPGKRYSSFAGGKRKNTAFAGQARGGGICDPRGVLLNLLEGGTRCCKTAVPSSGQEETQSSISWKKKGGGGVVRQQRRSSVSTAVHERGRSPAITAQENTSAPVTSRRKTKIVKGEKTSRRLEKKRAHQGSQGK